MKNLIRYQNHFLQLLALALMVYLLINWFEFKTELDKLSSDFRSSEIVIPNK